MDKDSAIEELAKRLYWKLEQLDPISDDEWDDLDEGERRVYRFAVEDLVQFDKLVAAAQSSSANPLAQRHASKA